MGSRTPADASPLALTVLLGQQICPHSHGALATAILPEASSTWHSPHSPHCLDHEFQNSLSFQFGETCSGIDKGQLEFTRSWGPVTPNLHCNQISGWQGPHHLQEELEVLLGAGLCDTVVPVSLGSDGEGHYSGQTGASDNGVVHVAHRGFGLARPEVLRDL